MQPLPSLAILLLCCATLAHAEVLTRTHADGSTSTVVPAPYVGPPAPLALGVSWPFFPYHTEQWRLRAAAQDAEQRVQAAEGERRRVPPPSSLVAREQADVSRALQVLQVSPSMASDLDEGARRRLLRRERA